MENKSFKYQLFLKLSYYDFNIIDKLINSLITLLNSFFDEEKVILAKITFPLKKNIITVLKSPHVSKKSREQFRKSIYSFGLSIKIVDLNDFKFIYYFLINSLKKTNCKFNLKSKIFYEKK